MYTVTHVQCDLFLQRDARLKMCPTTEQDKFLIPETILGNTPKVVEDEHANGEYGLVINGHSLVRNSLPSVLYIDFGGNITFHDVIVWAVCMF